MRMKENRLEKRQERFRLEEEQAGKEKDERMRLEAERQKEAYAV